MAAYTFQLEKYHGADSRFDCPACGKAKEFTRYIDLETGTHVAPDVGICNRKSQCGYHKPPKEHFKRYESSPKRPFTRTFPVEPVKPASFIPFDIFQKSLCNYNKNHFITFLNGLFGNEVVAKLIQRYYLGTSNHWPGATVFWQVDGGGKIRSGKIMLYSPVTGKRSKDKYHCPNWIHSVLKMPDFNLKQRLFGEHLLKGDPDKPVAIVESEKTAIIASAYMSDYIWLASGSLTNICSEKCDVLRGRNVTLFPDLNGYDKWSKKAIDLSHIALFKVSDYLEKVATSEEKAQGLDIADFLVRVNFKDCVVPKQ